MKQVLVIGAGNFGKLLICELIENGCAVDVIDKETTPHYALRCLGGRYIRNNAWNISTMKEVRFSDYDCCYLCMTASQPLNFHVIESLRKAGARRIVVRAKQAQEVELLLRAGADQVICPEQFTSKSLAQEIAGFKRL